MALYKRIIASSLLLLLAGCSSSPPLPIQDPMEISAGTSLSPTASQILYLAQSGNIDKAIDLYLSSESADFETLQTLANIIIRQGYQSNNPETVLLTIYGASIANDPRLFYIMERGLKIPVPEIQLAAINLLGQTFDDRANTMIAEALSSPFFICRLEALHHLALVKYPQIEGHIEGLMYKVPKKFRPVFPQLFALAGNHHAIEILRKLLFDTDVDVSVAAILAAAEYGHDQLLPEIRLIASHNNLAQQEACAMALGIFKDEPSVAILNKMTSSHAENIRLAALYSLYQLGNNDVTSAIAEIALKGNAFAIGILGNITQEKQTLYKLINHPTTEIRINAAIALLQQRDPQCIQGILEILIRDPRDLAIAEVFSIGNTLPAYKIIPSTQENLDRIPYLEELSTSIRERLLIETLELSQKNFLFIAEEIFDTQQKKLIPLVVKLLANIKTPNAIELLKKQQQRPGSPLTRAYSNLALCQLNEPGPYYDNLTQWITEHQDTDIIKFRPLVPWQWRKNENPSNYSLTPQETSNLLIDSLQTIASYQDIPNIKLLLLSIKNGNPHNRPTLAGLLIKTTI